MYFQPLNYAKLLQITRKSCQLTANTLHHRLLFLRRRESTCKMVQVIANCSNPPIPVLLSVEHLVSQDENVVLKWGSETCIEGTRVNGDSSVARHLGRVFQKSGLYGSSILDASEIDHWIDFSAIHLKNVDDAKDALVYLDRVLAPAAHLVGHSFTLADFAMWGAFKANPKLLSQLKAGGVGKHVSRWFNYCSAQDIFYKVSCDLAKTAPATDQSQAKPNKRTSGGLKSSMEEGGRFIELPDAADGEVVVRFPPEASGYLHIGHAKAALLNQFYKEKYNGKLIMRFDDTNPAKENAHFEDIILQDIKLLHLTPDHYSRTSDHFDLCLKFADQIIRSGHAYCDDTPADEMKERREKREPSKHRNNSIEKNLAMWEEMKRGSISGLQTCLRAKIDYQSDNGTMRDPVIYRCKDEPHLVTGAKYKVYPTYDFACPIVDSVEGVTHALRTTEYHDRDPQYYWLCQALGIRRPYIYEYSRLALINTVLSKRKLTYLVNEGYVNGWDDPRLPTVRGIMRRGLTVQGLKEFIIAQGSSKSNVHMEWDKIWAFNRKVIDPIAPRYTALLARDAVPIKMNGAKVEHTQYPLHPKNPDVGSKKVFYSPEVLIDGEDAALLKDGDLATFINWGNIRIKKVNRDASGKVKDIEADLELENKDFKKTAKLTWLAQHSQGPFVPTVCVDFDHIITKDVITKNDNFKDYVAKNTRREEQMFGDPELLNVKKGDIIQLQRRGFYICDQAYEAASRHSGRECPLILISIPDGHSKTPAVTEKAKNAPSPQKGSGKEKKGKASEQKRAVHTDATNLTKSDSVGQTGPPPEAELALFEKVTNQGNKVRDLKTAGASKEEVAKEVAVLLELKKEYKTLTGKDYKPATAGVVKGNKKKVQDEKAPQAMGSIEKPAEVAVLSPEAGQLLQDITEQGNKVRELKSGNGSKEDIDSAVKKLLELKAQYKALTGSDMPRADQGRKEKGGKKKEGAQKDPAKKKEEPTKKAEKKEEAAAEGSGPKKVTRLGLEAKKEESLSDWYSQVITRAEMIEYYDVSGCYVLRPWAYGIWERICKFFDAEIAKLGVENCYFPMFVSQGALEKEKTHIGDFAPEVAWVTRSGSSELQEPIAIRPTSETVMYPTFAKWVQSHRDLPIKVNQWCNVVRWEFKHPQPFLRTREFLWQEGHTAFATREEAVEEVYKILDLYSQVYTDLLAIPVIKGRKTEKERFAGGDFTTTCEAYIEASGRAIQGATSHHLGQNFSKMFEIMFEDPSKPDSKEKLYVHQNSWGLTTRTIGVMVMVHGDDQGLVLPPKVANVQVIIVPCGITATLAEEKKDKLLQLCKTYEEELRSHGVRVKGDYRDNYSPGWKFNHWELKGVPIRIEIGPKDMESNQFVAVRRDNREKNILKNKKAGEQIQKILDAIQKNLYTKADSALKKHLGVTLHWDEFLSLLDKKMIIQAPFCGDEGCEDNIKKDSARDESLEPGAPSMGAKSLCIPFMQPAELASGTKCVHPQCSREAKYYCLFGRSY